MIRAAIVAALVAAPVVASSAPPVKICDEAECASVTGGALDVNATVNATTEGTATAAAPTYLEGTSNPFSLTLDGKLRTDASVSVPYADATGSTVPAQAAFVAGTDGTNTTPILVDSSGNVQTEVVSALPAGTNQIGHVITDPTSVTRVTDTTGSNVMAVDASGYITANINGTVPVSGTFWQATQPVSIAATVTTSDTHTTAGSPLSVRLSDGASFLSQNANGQATMANSAPTVLASDQVAADDSAAASQNLGVLPLLIETSTTLPTSTDGRRTHLLGDGDRKLYVRTYDSDPLNWNTGASTVTTDTQIAGLSGASLSYYITDVFIDNHSSTTISVGLVSSATADNACATSPVVVHVPVQVRDGVGVSRALVTPIKVTANHALCCDTGGSTAFTCQVHGFIAP